MGYIYKITNTINNKIYIGQTSKTIQERFSVHISKAKQKIMGILFWRMPDFFMLLLYIFLPEGWTYMRTFRLLP